MGEHADADADGLIEVAAPRHRPNRAAVLVAGLLALVAVGALAGWFGYRAVEEQRVSAERREFVDAARQGVVNLTTIAYSTVDADVQRILDSSTGTFHDDFEKRSAPFAEAVRQAQSTSEGTVTEAAIESQDGDTAAVLVTVSMAMTYPTAPPQPPNSWRMRIAVEKRDGATKITDVQFVG